MAYMSGGGGGRSSGGSAGSAVKRRLVGKPAGSQVRRGTGSVRHYSSSGGGSISSNSSGRYSPPSPPPTARPGGGAIPSINAFLGRDTGYQQQLRQYGKSLSDFTADLGRRRGSLTAEYGLSQKAMNDQKLRDLEALEEDYGSRGILKSGLYADAVGDYNTEFGTRMSDLQRRQNEALASLTQESSQFTSQTNLQKQAAKEAAIRRRAEQFGV